MLQSDEQKKPDPGVLPARRSKPASLAGFPGSQTVYAGLMVFVIWTFLHMAIGSAIIPSPWQTAAHFIAIFPGTLARHLLVSLWRILTALFCSLLLGGAAGLWIGLSGRADRWITPYAVFELTPTTVFGLPGIAGTDGGEGAAGSFTPTRWRF